MGIVKKSKTFILRCVDKFKKRDGEEASELYHTDAVNIQVAIGKPLKDRKAIQNKVFEIFQKIPDSSTRFKNLSADGEGRFCKNDLARGKEIQFQQMRIISDYRR